MGKGFGRLALGALLQLSRVRAVGGRETRPPEGLQLSPLVVEMAVAAALAVASEMVCGLGLPVAAMLASLAMARARAGRE